jgi:competence protein ComGC
MNAILPILAGLAQGTQQREQRNYDRGLQTRELDSQDNNKLADAALDFQKRQIPYATAKSALMQMFAHNPKLQQKIQNDTWIEELIKPTKQQLEQNTFNTNKNAADLADIEAGTKVKVAQAKTYDTKYDVDQENRAFAAFGKGDIDRLTFDQWTNNKYLGKELNIGPKSTAGINRTDSQTNKAKTETDLMPMNTAAKIAPYIGKGDMTNQEHLLGMQV